MADGDLFKLDAEDLKAVGAAPRDPRAVVTGVRGIAPQNAVDAITHGPTVGVPPSLAMHDPTPVKDMAASQNVTAILSNFPSVRKWASGEPARTAATQDDFPALAKIGGWFEDRFADFVAPAQEGWKSYIEGLEAVKRADTGRRTGFTSLLPQETDAQAAALAKVEEGASRLSPFSVIPNTLFSPITRPVARQLVKIPGYVPKGKTEEQEVRDTSDVLNIVGSVFIPLGASKAFGRKAPPPEPTPEGFPQGPTGGINRDFAHPVDEAGVVMGADEVALNFATQKEAAQWILKQGYADKANPQIFEVATGEGAGYVVRQTGVAEGAMPRPGASAVSDTVYAAAAEADGKRIATLEAQIAESKTQGRSPAIMAEFLEEQTPGRMVWIDPEKALALYNEQGVVPTADDGFLGSVPGFLEGLENASVAGHDIQVPLSGYLAASAGKPWADSLRDSVRFREDGVSVEESKILGEPLTEIKLEPADETSKIPHGANLEDFYKNPLPVDSRTWADAQVGGTQKENDLKRRQINQAHRDAIETSLPIDKLIGIENALGKKALLEPSENLPFIEKVGGKYYIMDGNHRVVNQLLRGAKTVRVKLANLDKAFGHEVSEVPQDIEPADQPRAETLAAASRDAIVSQVKTQFLNGLFKDEKSAGMTKDQFNRYSKAVETAVGNAYTKLVERSYNQIRRERTPEWRAAFDQTLAKVQEEFYSRSDIQALFYLRYGQHPNGAPVEPLKLRKTAVQDMYGEGLTNSLPDGIFGRDGVTADEAAEVFGYESGDSMLRELAALEDGMRATGMSPRDYLSKLTRAQAHRETGEALGFDITPESIHAAASEAVASPEIESILSDELSALADQAGLTLDRAGIGLEAERIFGELPVKLALNIREFERVIGIKGRMAEINLLKSNPVEAFRAKQQQLMNQIMLQRAHKLVKDYAKTEKKFTRWARTSANKNIDQAYMNYVHAALFRLGYRVKRDFEELMDQIGGTSLSDFITNKELQGDVFVWGDFPGTPLKEMKVKEYDAARDTLSSLVHNGRKAAGVVILGRRESFATLVSRIRENGDSLGRKHTPERIEGKRPEVGSISQKLATRLDNVSAPVREGMQAVNSFMTKMEQLLDEMDLNDPLGPLNRAVMYPLQTAAGHENDWTALFVKEIRAFAKENPKVLQRLKTNIDVPELQWLNPHNGLMERVASSRGNLFRLMMNLGREENRAKLLEGYQWSLEDVMSVLNKHMVKEDWDFAQLLWDQFETLWPEIASTYRNLSGIAPRRAKALAIETPFGTYKGGYFPISYDKLRAPEAKTMSSDSIFGEDYTSSLPANPYTKGVTGYVAPISLAFHGLNKTLGQIIHDVAFREPLVQANRVLSNPIVRAAIQDNFGPSYTAQLRPWLEYIAREKVFDDRAGSWQERALKQFRSNATFVGLAFRRTSAMIHFDVAMSDSVGEVGLGRFVEAVGKLYQTPAQWQYYRNFIHENSAEIRHRAVTMDNNIREAVNALVMKNGVLDDIEKFGYHMLAMSDTISAEPTWLAKYWEAIEDHSHEEAVLIADKGVRNAHGSGKPIDVAAIQRGGVGTWGELGKSTYGLFLSFMNHAWNRGWRILRGYGKAYEQAANNEWEGARRDFSKSAAMTFWYIIFASTSLTMLKAWFKRGNPVPENAWDWTDGIVHTTFGGSPMADVVFNSVEGVFGHQKFRPKTPIDQMASKSLVTAKNFKEVLDGRANRVSDRWLKDALEATGYWTGKVSGATAKDFQYIWDYSTGQEQAPRNVNEAMHLIATGDRKGYEKK